GCKQGHILIGRWRIRRCLISGAILLLLRALYGLSSSLFTRGFCGPLHFGLSFGECSLKPEIVFHIRRKTAPEFSVKLLGGSRKAQRGCKGRVVRLLSFSK